MTSLYDIPDRRLDPPEEAEARSVATCESCGEAIRVGEYYYELDDGTPVCDRCWMEYSRIMYGKVAGE